MKYFSLLLVGTLMLTVTGCRSGDCIRGSGKQISSIRDIEQFSSIKVSGAVKLIVQQGSQQQLRIVADDNVQDGISTKVRNDQLVINMDDNFCEPGPVTIYITSANLEGIDVSGIVEVLSQGRINATSFNLDLSGASKAMLDISCGEINIKTSGSCNVMLKGQAGINNLEMSGSSELNAFDFAVGKYNINTSGSSALKINVLNDLNVNSSGSSQIEYRGNPQHISNDKSGSSNIQKVD